MLKWIKLSLLGVKTEWFPTLSGAGRALSTPAAPTLGTWRSPSSSPSKHQTHTESGECLSCERQNYPCMYSNLRFTMERLELHLTSQNQPWSTRRPPLCFNCQTCKRWPRIEASYLPRAREKMEINLIYSVWSIVSQVLNCDLSHCICRHRFHSFCFRKGSPAHKQNSKHFH